MGFGFPKENIFGNPMQEPFFNKIHFMIDSTFRLIKLLQKENMKVKRLGLGT
jgi:hypothetical protein